MVFNNENVLRSYEAIEKIEEYKKIDELFEKKVRTILSADVNDVYSARGLVQLIYEEENKELVINMVNFIYAMISEEKNMSDSKQADYYFSNLLESVNLKDFTLLRSIASTIAASLACGSKYSIQLLNTAKKRYFDFFNGKELTEEDKKNIKFYKGIAYEIRGMIILEAASDFEEKVKSDKIASADECYGYIMLQSNAQNGIINKDFLDILEGEHEIPTEYYVVLYEKTLDEMQKMKKQIINEELTEEEFNKYKHRLEEDLEFFLEFIKNQKGGYSC